MVRRIGSTAQRLRQKPYEKRVCRFESYPSCLMPEYPFVGLSVEEYVEYLRDVGLEMQVVAAEMDRGTPRFRSKLIPPHPDVDRDRLPRFIELAHESGILVLSYYSMNYCKPLMKIHPEWRMEFLDDGRPAPENLGWFCFNSGFRDWVPQYLNEFVDCLDLDGLYFDDMNWGSHEEGPFWPSCCCPVCTDLFRREAGLEIPRKVEFASATFRRWLRWRSDKMREFMVHVTRKVRQAHPDAILDFNYYAGVYGNWSLGHPLNPLHLEKPGGYFFIERTAYDGSSLAAKMARAQGSPGAVWLGPTQCLAECVNHTAPYAESLTPTVDGLAVIQNGARPILALVDGPVPLRRELVKATFAEFRKRVEFMEGDTVKYVALHWSQQSRDLHRPSANQTESAADYFRQIRGTYEILKQSHLLADIVLDEQLTVEHLQPYKVLFLSDSACLSDGQCEAIRTFVRNGGTLLATHETSLMDEWGQRRENFQLADVLGVDYAGPAGGGAVHGIVYVSGAPDERVMCFAGRASCVMPRAGAGITAIYTRSSLQGPRPLDKLDLRMNLDSGQPAVTCHAFGKGKAFYISGDVGGGYSHNPYPPLKRFVAGLIRNATPPVEIEAPKVIEAAAATPDPQRLIIHLLNNPIPFFALSQRPDNFHDVCTYFYNLEELNPVFNIRIRLNGFRPARARLPLRNQTLSIAGEPPVLIVPEVQLQEVVLLEGEWIQ